MSGEKKHVNSEFYYVEKKSFQSEILYMWAMGLFCVSEMIFFLF